MAADIIVIVCGTDAVLAKAFEHAKDQSSLNVLSNTFLVHLGLIKVCCRYLRLLALCFSTFCFTGK